MTWINVIRALQLTGHGTRGNCLKDSDGDRPTRIIFAALSRRLISMRTDARGTCHLCERSICLLPTALLTSHSDKGDYSRNNPTYITGGKEIHVYLTLR